MHNSRWPFSRFSFTFASTLSFFILLLLGLLLPRSYAQQTLGALNGEVMDSTGAVVQGVNVKARALATNLEVTATSKADGSFSIADLPIGTYEVTFKKEGFQTAVYPQIIVQGNRTATVNASLKPGAVSSTVEVEATPLLNQTDTTTGYVLGDTQIENIPLGTGSFTQLAILSPGVSADFLNTSGTNAGFGNQAIWADGQRDTSNSFSFNGVYANNIFNGKSTSQVASARVAVNIGESGNETSGNPTSEIVTSTSVYGAIGQALPTPPPETIQEMRVNSAMYDASQGANSGAHIELITKSGTNNLHGGVYEYHQTTGWNANQWFFNLDGIPREPLHRNVFGGLLGGPIKKDRLFFFASYQGQRVADHLLGISLVAVPPGLSGDRSAPTLATLLNNDFGGTPCAAGTRACTASDITAAGQYIMNLKAPDGSYYIPSSASGAQLATLQSQNADAEIIGPGSLFIADQVNGNIDYYFNTKDRLAGKYYFQRDPNASPFAQSELEGFPQTMQAGSQAVSIDNTRTVTPSLTWEQRVGFIREKAFATTSQLITPQDIGMNLFGLTKFPSISIGDADGPTLLHSLAVGPTSNFANAGIFQNNYELATSLNWVRGRQSISSGVNWDYTQLNIVNLNNQLATVNFPDFPTFLTGGLVCSEVNYCSSIGPSQFLNGASNRHYRTNQVGAYVQDNIKLKPNITMNLGLRWDWDGPLTEKNGMLTNFYPQNYSYDVATDTVNDIGLVVAGNNSVFGTKGVSNSTLSGRQWGFAPRFGLVYSPRFLKNVVVRTGFGLYYDRGEYFTELSPPAGGGYSGPFGVTVEEPFVVPVLPPSTGSFANPFGTTPPPPPPSNLSQVKLLVPNAGDIVNQTTPYCIQTGQEYCSGLYFGGYDPRNKLPYAENWTLDFQWQPVNTLVASIAYVGSHGVHGVMPLPFNQDRIATPQNPTLAGGPYQQNYSYGWQVPNLTAEDVQTLVLGYATGNAALRTPYIGYDPNSEYNEAIGNSNYDALQVSVDKRVSHGLLFKASYTFSHALDEQSGLGLFFTGNNPNNPRSSYGTSDFDRTHVFTINYLYDFPKLASLSGWRSQVVNGWGFSGITVLQSGQPYSVNDYSGSVAGIFYNSNNYVTNPIVPVGGVGATSNQPRIHQTINGVPYLLNPDAFGPPSPYAPGTNGVPPCDPVTHACDYYETGFAAVNQRNIFRAPFQDRFDFGLFKNFRINERWALRYDVQAFNIFNHPSFDIPSNSVVFAPDYQNPPIYGPMGDTNYTPCVPSTGAFACPPYGNLGALQHTIGSPRFLQMALHVNF